MIATTIMSSIKVNPACCFLFIELFSEGRVNRACLARKAGLIPVLS